MSLPAWTAPSLPPRLPCRRLQRGRAGKRHVRRCTTFWHERADGRALRTGKQPRLSIIIIIFPIATQRRAFSSQSQRSKWAGFGRPCRSRVEGRRKEGEEERRQQLGLTLPRGGRQAGASEEGPLFTCRRGLGEKRHGAAAAAFLFLFSRERVILSHPRANWPSKPARPTG